MCIAGYLKGHHSRGIHCTSEEEIDSREESQVMGAIFVVSLEGIHEGVQWLTAAARAVEADLEAGAGIEEEQQHWHQCEGEEKEEGQTGIWQVLAAHEGHISLVEQIELWQCVTFLVIDHYRHQEVHRHTENLDIREEEKSSKGIH